MTDGHSESDAIFSQLREEGHFIDAVLRVGDVDFNVHRIIMCTCGPYFEDLFTSSLDKTVFEISGVSPDMMQLIINFGYDDTVSVTRQNVRELLLAALELKVMGIVEMCCDFLGEELCPENCIGIWQFISQQSTNISQLQQEAHQYMLENKQVVSNEEQSTNISQLQQEAHQYMLENEQVVSNEEQSTNISQLQQEAHQYMLENEQFVSNEEQSTNILQLPHRAHQFILDNFEQVVSTEEFQQLSAGDLCDMIQSDELKVRKESTVFEAVHRWITHAPETREEHLMELLSKVRFALLSSDYINTNVRTNELVNSNRQCFQFLEDALRIKETMSRSDPPLSAVRNYLARPRLPKEILLAIGGWTPSRNRRSHMEAFDIRMNRWLLVTNEHRARGHHGTAFLDGYIYCLGGQDLDNILKSVERFDLRTQTWDQVSPMRHQRCFVATAVLDGFIYALGGKSDRSHLRTAERYRPETNQWSLIASMGEVRSNASCTTLHNKIYICGGSNGQEIVQTCECYTPETNQWTMITPMSIRRSGAGVVAYAGHVYAIGGLHINTPLSSVEAYNPQTDSWHSVPAMTRPRSNFGVGVIDNQIFVVGGFNNQTNLNNVEYFDADTNRWSTAEGMWTFRQGLSCCVVSGLPNMVDYIVPRDTLPLLALRSRRRRRRCRRIVFIATAQSYSVQQDIDIGAQPPPQ